MRITRTLNGTWLIAPGEKDQLPREWPHHIPVPGLVDLAEPAYEWTQVDYHWYKTTIERKEHSRRLAFLKFDQSQFGTEVWLDGNKLGGSMSCYTSHEYRIDDRMPREGQHELVVRVGGKHTLRPESAVGKDQENQEYNPGIWGDVYLIECGNPRITHVQIIPDLETQSAEARITIENCLAAMESVELSCRVLEKRSGRSASDSSMQILTIPPGQSQQAIVHLRIHNCHLWSPDSPFLYELEPAVTADGKSVDMVRTTFGMREFKIVKNEFYLNGKPIRLRGGNIAFHRFLSDRERRALPWTREWIKRVLIDIPKSHNFNFFRNHLGQMYNAWYDLADEYGMLIQNEWQFWGTTGTKEQITKEFTEWLQDNWNHPGIIIWDALNESTDEIVQKEIVPEMKKLDPTRPWESVDFVEEHPYLYSLGPVLYDRSCGFARALKELEQSVKPTVLNEFVWWWMDNAGKPTVLMDGIVERWLGKEYTKDELLEHQAFLAQELVKLVRRMRVNAIQPFVYLSNNHGPTAHWFQGPIEQLQPKPILGALKSMPSLRLASASSCGIVISRPTKSEGSDSLSLTMKQRQGAGLWSTASPMKTETGLPRIPWRLRLILPAVLSCRLI